MSSLRLYLLQRISALIMVPLVLGHLAMMIYAVRDGLSAQEILSRTRGSLFWGTYYSVFVLAACTHGAIGLRTIIAETTGFSGLRLNSGVVFVGMVATYLGLYAVFAVTWTGAAQ